PGSPRLPELLRSDYAASSFLPSGSLPTVVPLRERPVLGLVQDQQLHFCLVWWELTRDGDILTLLNTTPARPVMIDLKVIAMGASRQLCRGCFEIMHVQARQGTLP